jgi:histone H3/H4
MPKSPAVKRFIIPVNPFQRLVREIMLDTGTKMNFKKEAMQALQEVSEEMLTELFLKADMARGRVGRKTVHLTDIQFAKYITNDKELLQAKPPSLVVETPLA